MINKIDYGSAVFVSDLNRALKFYTSLGFEEQQRGNKPRVSWIEVALAGDDNWMALIAFEEANQFADRIGGYTSLIFLTDDIQRSYQMFRDKNVQFEYEPTSRPWGDSDALFLDQDNNKLLLVERDRSLTVLGRSHRPTD